MEMSSDNLKDSVNFRKLRYFCDLLYAQNHPAVKEIRCGSLQRRTRILKSYNSGFYVLTPSGFLHEFKSDNLSCDQIPIMSLCLREYEISEHSPANSRTYKFSLKGFKNGNTSRVHTFVFRAKTYDEMIDWYNDIKKFTGLLNMSEEEFRDYVVALQVGNVVDDQVTDVQNDISDQEKKFSLVLNDDFKNDVDIMTSVSSAFYETKSSVPNGQEGNAVNKEDINEEHIVSENGYLNKKNTSFGEKNGLSDSLNGDIISEQEKSVKDMLVDAPGTCLNDPNDLKETMTLRSSSGSSYSSTNEYSCPLEVQNSSLDYESGLGKSAVDMQKNSNQRDRSGSLHTVSESLVNDNQELRSLLSSDLHQLPLPMATQSKFKEDLEQSTFSNVDISDISENKLDLEQEQSSALKNIELVNGADNVSSIPNLVVLEGSHHQELNDNLQVLDESDLGSKLHKNDKDVSSKNL